MTGSAGAPAIAGELLAILRTVKDPEVPVLDIVELGIVRGAERAGDGVRVDVTPTYSGCPAMYVIEEEIAAAFRARGYREVEVRRVFTPPWTTDWMSSDARRKLREYGIAPPGPAGDEGPVPLGPTVRRVACPWCGSPDTALRSEFGSTACKSLHYCRACRQPFEHFKPL